MSTARLLEAKGKSRGTAVEMRLYIFNNFLDPQRNSGSPFSHSRVITGLGFRRGSIGLSSSWDRKPAQPRAIVVGKWVWRMYIGVAYIHYIMCVFSEVLVYSLLHSHFARKIYTWSSVLFDRPMTGCRSLGKILEYYLKIKIYPEKESESCHCRRSVVRSWLIEWNVTVSENIPDLGIVHDRSYVRLICTE